LVRAIGRELREAATAARRTGRPARRVPTAHPFRIDEDTNRRTPITRRKAIREKSALGIVA